MKVPLRSKGARKQEHRKMGGPTRVQILVFTGATPIVPVGVFDLLRKADELSRSLGRTHRVAVELVAVAPKRQVTSAGDLVLRCHHTLAEAPAADFVVISPLDAPVLDRESRDPALRRFLRRAYRRGADIASVCTGTFALAESGLLDGRAAATHWAFQPLFGARFPRVQLRPQEILLDTGRLLTTGGATSFLNYTVYLIERIFDEETARLAARMFLIDHKAPQGAYAVFSGQKQHGDAVVLRAQELIEQNAAQALSLQQVASRVALSRRTFIRRFQAATGSTPREYLQRARIELAKRRLEGSVEGIAQVAQQVGYEDQAAFRRLFQRYTGLTPTEYRRRYGALRARSNVG